MFKKKAIGVLLTVALVVQIAIPYAGPVFASEVGDTSSQSVETQAVANDMATRFERDLAIVQTIMTDEDFLAPIEAPDQGSISIATRTDLERIGNDPAYQLDASYSLTADIDLSGGEWTPIGSKTNPFSGVFDGQGHKIKDMTITAGNGQYYGLFGYTQSAVIKNVGMANTRIDTSAPICYAGSIVGYDLSSTALTNCWNSGSLSFSSLTASSFSTTKIVGGIAGVLSDLGTIEHCYNTGDITSSAHCSSGSASSHVGGIAGRVSAAEIRNCYNVGDVNADSKGNLSANPCAGGIIGSVASKTTVENCSNGGNVYSRSENQYNPSVYSGGIVGYVSSSMTVDACYNAGGVSSFSQSPFTGSNEYSGGIVAYAPQYISISNCYNAGSVSFTETVADSIGGIIGCVYSALIVNCYNIGDVSAPETVNGIRAGGIAGMCSSNSSVIIENCHNAGAVSSGVAGGIAGDAYSSAASSVTIQNCRNTGNIFIADHGTSFLGGIVGILGTAVSSSAVIRGCYNAGNIFADVNVNGRYSRYFGGIAGRLYLNSPSDILIEDCGNTGDVTASYGGSDALAGGIVGQTYQITDDDHSTMTITNCSNEGDVSAASSSYNSAYAGGITGANTINNNLATISNCTVKPDSISAVHVNATRAYSYVISSGNATKTNNGAKQGIAGDPVYDADYFIDEDDEDDPGDNDPGGEIKFTLSHELIDSVYTTTDIPDMETSVESRRDTYRITADIVNPSTTDTLSNIQLTLNLPISLAVNTYLNLSNGVDTCILINSLAPEGSINASWDIEYVCSDDTPDQNLEYSVTVIADNILSMSNYGNIFANGYNEKNNTLDFSKDTWSFKNYITGIKSTDSKGKNIYEPIPISSDDFEAFLYGLSNSDKSYFYNMKEQGAGGQCYGMAITSVLAKVHRLDLNRLQSGVSDLHSVSDNAAAKSTIGYYYLTQYLEPHKLDIGIFFNYNTTKQLEIIEQLADAVDSGGNPFVLSFYNDTDFDGNFGEEGEGGHAVTAYGFERGNWEFETDSAQGRTHITYDSRILIYDNNFPVWNDKYDDNYWLYYNKGSDKWTIPYYLGASASDGIKKNARLGGALADVNLMDVSSLPMNLKNVASSIRAKNNTNLLIRLRNKTLTINGTNTNGATNVRAFPDLAANSSSAINIYLDDMEQDFSIEPQTEGEPLDVSVKYGSTFATAETTSAQAVTFSPDGKVGISDNGGEYKLLISSDAGPLAWYEISVIGTSDSSLSLEKTDEGYLLNGDTQNTEITGKNDSETKVLSITADKDKVLIAQKDKNLIALIDNDEDGAYETEIDSSEKPNLPTVPPSSTPPNTGSGGGSPSTAETVAKPDEDEKTEPSPAWLNPFTDVKQSDWFYGDVEYVSVNGLFNGTSATAFSPTTPMTRGMLTTVLARLNGTDLSAYTASGFDDVADGKYYTAAVAWAAANGIVSGVGSDEFAPDRAVTRQEMAAMIVRYAEFAKKQFPTTRQFVIFADDDRIADWAKNAVQTLYCGGIVSGKPGNIFDPQGNATRAEVAAILHRFGIAIGDGETNS
ncbi:MAG: S-layer homology domain-containing protein [Clostridiales Family XIII bacterium]|nr:S-layer homology domain-containing protein [Clostridiales Family XIII bacterium]